MTMLRSFTLRIATLPLFLQLLGITLLGGLALVWQRGSDGRFIDLFLTADQQGRLLFDSKQYGEAAKAFAEPAWRGTAEYRAGDYTAAAESYARLGTSVGFFNRGNAFMRAFEYRKAITSYEQAVADAPQWEEARENLELARYTLDYIERTREQSDTGEESGIGADEVVYDNTSDRGSETEVTRDSVVEAQSAEKWMRSVDTETAEFLRTRFFLEASRERRE
ncbi:MAG: hypothetical protein AAGL66_06405 [Pseudomonadota bacterium]